MRNIKNTNTKDFIFHVKQLQLIYSEYSWSNNVFVCVCVAGEKEVESVFVDLVFGRYIV